jgi:hypothetical protein
MQEVLLAAGVSTARTEMRRRPGSRVQRIGLARGDAFAVGRAATVEVIRRAVANSLPRIGGTRGIKRGDSAGGRERTV